MLINHYATPQQLCAALAAAWEQPDALQTILQQMAPNSAQITSAQDWSGLWQALTHQLQQQFTPDMAFVTLPGGPFEMGSLEYEDEKPVHRVRLAPFQLQTTAVTFDQFDIYCEAVGIKKPDDEDWGRGNRPVINISWDDAQAYIAWLNTTLQADPPYRLPSEAEWEYAARAGTTTAYWWGDAVGQNHANCSGCGSQWDNQMTAPVKSFPPNPWGLYEMNGNVWEWCADGWHRSYQGAPSDGSAWHGGDNKRVVRGGSWYDVPDGVRSAYRDRFGRDDGNYDLGFRLSRDV